MKKLLVVLVGIVLWFTHVGAQSTRGPLEGVWQTVEVTLTGPAARTISIPEPRPNLMIVTARHYARVQVEGPRPMLSDPTKATVDALRAVWGPFGGEAGTYEVTGDVITMHPIAAKNPAAMVPGAFTVYSFKRDRNTLVVTEQRNQNGAFANPVTVKAVRIE